MSRPTTKLAYSNLEDFHRFYVESLDDFRELNKIDFESFDKFQEKDFLLHYSKIQKNLESIGVSSSNTMVTKILMAVTGQTPAFDTYFIGVFREKVGSFSENIYKALLKLSKKYNEEWKNELIGLPEEYTNIRGESQDIISVPVARLIDMGFWSYGEGGRSERAKKG